ncbi:hypothetical protein [Staphylococcus caeli]|uniref:Uncharacterized protein n=1 Tax=Staphylococcus caeli TaxID=2201815 RepID=A0A1D4NSZ9_9STAP|nr:hypothetical protein [Staphylococcus caeli]AWM30221.1 hypothetical protein SCC82B_00081 [Staphylococcus caeli]SCT09251.1 Uncharacterised protein [Staphylococcus caeli]SCT13796.1 Uncharacterised protein [Staphylococcus caeli]
MDNSIWSDFEKFWNKKDINEKSIKYQELFNNPSSNQDFTWINKSDVLNSKSKAVNWGIPNHILGDIDNSNFIIGLFNPGTNMKKNISEKCNTVGKYIITEREFEKSLIDTLNVQSKEVFEISNYKLKDNKELCDFYYEHILSKESILSLEIKKLFEIYKMDKQLFNSITSNYNQLSSIAYYFAKYYSKVFQDKTTKPLYKNAILHFKNIFKKIELAEKIRLTNRVEYNIEELFEEALFKISVTNIELVPYRSFNKMDWNNIKELESSKLSAKAIIKKILNDKNTIVILRSISDWKKYFIEICKEENIDFENEVAPSIYKFKSQNASLSNKGFIPILGNKADALNIKSVEAVTDALRETIKLKEFEENLDTFIARYKNE